MDKVKSDEASGDDEEAIPCIKRCLAPWLMKTPLPAGRGVFLWAYNQNKGQGKSRANFNAEPQGRRENLMQMGGFCGFLCGFAL